jgi:hypothetical protein
LDVGTLAAGTVVPVLPGAVDSLGVEGLIDGRASPGAVPDTPEDLELDAPELLMSLDLELVAPDDPELEGLLVPILPQAARAKTHAKGMIQFFMKDSLKKERKRHISFSTAVKRVTGALNRKNPQKEVPICLCKSA